MHANALMFISNLAKQILIRGYLLLEFLDFRQKQTFLLNKCFLLEMAYELLSQSRKLTKTGGEGGGGGVKSGGFGGLKNVLKKKQAVGTLVYEGSYHEICHMRNTICKGLFLLQI